MECLAVLTDDFNTSLKWEDVVSTIKSHCLIVVLALCLSRSQDFKFWQTFAKSFNVKQNGHHQQKQKCQGNGFFFFFLLAFFGRPLSIWRKLGTRQLGTSASLAVFCDSSTRDTAKGSMGSLSFPSSSFS